jgi:MFS transporter, DHA1 family, tetracycline resistance protein
MISLADFSMRAPSHDRAATSTACFAAAVAWSRADWQQSERGGQEMATSPADNTALRFVAFVVFVDMCGLGIIVPVMPRLIETMARVPIDRAAEIGGWLLFAYAVMQFLFAPVIGGLSDRFGRRPVLLGTLAALGLDYALMAWAPTLAWLFVGRVIAGIMGASWAAANSCIADVTSGADRGRAFGLLGAAGAAGFVVGPALGGLLGQYGERLPFVAAAVLVLAGAGAGLFLLRETLPPSRRRSFTAARANPLGTVIQMARIPLVAGFLIVILLCQLAAQTTPAVWSYYTILKFGWTPLTIGLSATFFGILLAVAQGGLTGIASARLGEVHAATVALCAAVPAYLIFAFASAGWMMFLGIAVAAACNIAFPIMQGMMSREVAEDAQGELQGAVASAIGITAIIGPVLMTGIFGAFADRQGIYFPGAPFLLAALLFVLAIVQFARTTRRYAKVSA